ncbi:hypothetical protein COY16_00415 [Candidatus Roizmanbacteria bacterium CG_4_10_14_0_2_um_filter_39_13]|uniref:Uncharacterized protein n=1 Tax=Candidatus Roizmanbacteria bacterium CG_4_10_14_0_2_um_filter_39_13 TaxID=1974825 RepID=A0A2M7U1T3_9BACT|nr:MAG: hypothetical protein COY16_00415 [Candidatus Roizmanbacteria bacterium CG_4_10_14_0_2_um_filter_39_13]
MDTIQILLLIVLVISTIFLTVVGIQLALVLFELRRVLKNVNKIVKGFDTIGMGLKHGIGEATGFINGFKTVLKVIDLYKDKKNEKSKK